VDSAWIVAPSGNGGIRLSPDGRRVALAVIVSGSQDIWIKDLDAGPFAKLTFEGTNVRPEWSPDGRYVYYHRQGSTVGDGDVWRRRSDGTGEAELVLDLERSVWEIQQPADSSMTVVRFGVPPTRDIYLYRRGVGPGDSSLTPLAASDRFEENGVALSPDERWIAYASNESGRYEIYVRPFPDASGGRWQISSDGGNEPRWAHSGRELFYRREDGGLVAVAVEARGSGFAAGEQRVLFQADGFLTNLAYSNYSVAPDDRRFLFMRALRPDREAQLANTAILVQHWLDEVRAREVGGQ
jgi:serine/threonine-protein kinase